MYQKPQSLFELIEVNLVGFAVHSQGSFFAAFKHNGTFYQELGLFAQLASLYFEAHCSTSDSRSTRFADAQFAHCGIDLGIKMRFVAHFGHGLSDLDKGAIQLVNTG